MVRYIAAYDVESPSCLAACQKIVAVHQKHNMPATFFIVGKTLEANPDEYRALFDNPLFEVASHTYSHKILRDHPFGGPAPALDIIREEVLRGVETVERFFKRKCVGFRPAYAFDNAFRGADAILQYLTEAGVQYTSSLAWGPHYSLPAPLNQPFTYQQEGYANLWELPAHGWHDNVLKNLTNWGPRRLTLWPQPMPEAIPADFIHTPQQEVAINRVFIERALRDNLTFVSLIWHPWSLGRFDPAQTMPDMTFELVRELGLQPCTYADLRAAMPVN